MERWDRMTLEERAAASARVAAEEYELTDIPLLASDEQHRAVATALVFGERNSVSRAA